MFSPNPVYGTDCRLGSTPPNLRSADRFEPYRVRPRPRRRVRVIVTWQRRRDRHPDGRLDHYAKPDGRSEPYADGDTVRHPYAFSDNDAIPNSVALSDSVARAAAKLLADADCNTDTVRYSDAFSYGDAVSDANRLAVPHAHTHCRRPERRWLQPHCDPARPPVSRYLA